LDLDEDRGKLLKDKQKKCHTILLMLVAALDENLEEEAELGSETGRRKTDKNS
jgi:hypothetical protein